MLAEPIWHDPLILAVPALHPRLAYKEVPLSELASYPLVLCDPQVCEGYCRELTRLLRPLEREPNVVEHASSLDMMLTLVGAGYRSEEHTSELQSLMRISYAVFCLKKKI